MIVQQYMTASSVSIIIPLYNAERYIEQALEALFAQDYPGEKEIIVVNDGSADRSRVLIRRFEETGAIRVIDQPNQGAAAATNAGFKAARYDIICSVDSDVVLHHDFLGKVMAEFDDLTVGAVQGYYRTPKGLPFWARMMGYDVEKRYDDILGKYVTQVCTGDTAYRRSALDKAGLFDPDFVYGYDNDMSYRLQKAGYKLVFRKDAICDHYWKADITGYIKQQYRSAYGRMQLIQKHKDKVSGDSVSGLRMIMQVPLLLLCGIFFLGGVVAPFFGVHGYFFPMGFLCLGIMLVDRMVFSVSVIRKQKDLSALLLPIAHVLRNIVWGWALIRWGLARLFKR